MQSSWYSFSPWPHNDITSLGRSVNLHFLGLTLFYSRDVFGIGYQFFLSMHVSFPATQNTCERYNKFVIDHLKIILCTIGDL